MNIINSIEPDAAEWVAEIFGKSAVYSEERDGAIISIAISLKRIADALENNHALEELEAQACVPPEGLGWVPNLKIVEMKDGE